MDIFEQVVIRLRRSERCFFGFSSENNGYISSLFFCRDLHVKLLFFSSIFGASQICHYVPFERWFVPIWRILMTAVWIDDHDAYVAWFSRNGNSTTSKTSATSFRTTSKTSTTSQFFFTTKISTSGRAIFRAKNGRFSKISIVPLEGTIAKLFFRLFRQKYLYFGSLLANFG